MTETITKKVITGALWLFVGTGALSLFKLLSLIILVRYISPEEYGVASIANLIIGLSPILTALGTGKALVQKKNYTQDSVMTCLAFTVSLGLFYCLLFSVSGSVLVSIFNVQELASLSIYIGLAFLLRSLSISSEAVLHKNFLFKQLSISESISFLFAYCPVAIILAFHGYGYWSIVAGYLVYYALRSLMIIMYAKDSFTGKYSHSEFKQLWGFGCKLSIANIVNYFANQTDHLIISRSFGAEMIGYYGRAYQLAVMPTNIFNGILDRVLFSAYSEIQDELSKLRRGFLKTITLCTGLALPASILLFFKTEEIVNVLFGSDWITCVPFFKVMCCTIFFRMISKVSETVCRGIGEVKKLLVLQLIFLVLAVTLAATGALFGPIYVAIGILIAVIISSTLHFLLAIKLLDLSFSSLTHKGLTGLYMVTCTLAALATSNICKEWLHAHDWLDVLLACLLWLLYSYIFVATAPSKLVDNDLISMHKMAARKFNSIF